MLLRRLVLGAARVAIVSVIIFAGVELLPGDACTAFPEREAKGKLLENCREAQGLNRSAGERYFEWALGALQGDLGVSANGQRSISELIGDRLANSLLLAACVLVLGVPLAIFSMTIPEFVSATVLILVFSIWLGWLPGIVLTLAHAPASEFFPEILLPVLVLTMVMTAHILRMVRSSVIEVMAGDCVHMPTLKGVPYWRIVFRHALPNALLPAINVVALTIAWLLGGVVVIEVVFNYPGLGRMMIDTISDRDLPVVQAIAPIVATVYVGVNLSADLLTMVANPRLRTLHMRRK
ncbi:MAG: ABC transporter permease [Rhodobacteraceae bacterium]|nr:ABC transporter permease [Paracoccaceae bacterium]